MTARDLERRVLQAGWVEQPGRGRGGHRVYQHPHRPGLVVIPFHRGDLPKGTAEAILKQAGLK